MAKLWLVCSNYEKYVLLEKKSHEYATSFLDHEWVSKMAYLASRFNVL